MEADDAEWECLLLQRPAYAARPSDEKVKMVFASAGGSAIPTTLCPETIGKPRGLRADSKNKNNLECLRRDVSEIKLKRTDTTLDLSQKAKRAKEKRRKENGNIRSWKQF